MYKPKIGITLGDVNGIGIEVIIKALSNTQLLNQCTPVIYGLPKTFAHYKNLYHIDTFSFVTIDSAEQIQEGNINMIDCWGKEYKLEAGTTSEAAGRLAHVSLDHCVNDLKEKMIDAMVTAPINKKSMQLAGFPFPGHTEYLENEANGKSLMMLCQEDLRVALVTSHIPLGEVSEAISKDRVKDTIKRLNHSLIQDFGIERPIIAVLGLNPHAGDDGVLGEEEKKVIAPAIAEMKEESIFVHGPFAADGFFGSGNHKKFDAVVAMYHDQGLVAFKSLAFGKGVNFTAGLDIVRTSPDHGTGFDIVGENKADAGSFRSALFMALDVQRNRYEYTEYRKNKLVPSKKKTDRHS